MIPVDFAGSAVIITGGTRGLGKALGIEFARAGALVLATHRWGSVSEVELADEFAREGLQPPRVIECDASDADATRELMAAVRETGRPLHAIVSNVAFAKVVNELGDLRRKALELSLGYSAWPIVELVQAAHEVLGHYPRYALGISSDGPEVCHPGYDLAGVAKAALETLCRYLAVRLKGHGVRVNAVRPGFLDTASARATFGEERFERLLESASGLLLDPRDVARACLALCSGLMDSVTGQVLVVDEGWSLTSPVTWLEKGLAAGKAGGREASS